MRYFTKKEDDFLRNNCLTIPAQRMAAMLGRREGTARQRMKLLGIEVPKEVIEQFRQQSYYKKGQTPFNKGKKGADYLSDEALQNMKATQFAKGTVPPNHRPVGFERECSKDGYVYAKVGEGMRQFRLKHRVVYEQHFGAIPKGYNVQFKDGDKRNFSPDNLELVSKSGNMRRNTVHNYPKEISLAVQMIGAINRQINKRKKVS